jgi:hypothetical protein
MSLRAQLYDWFSSRKKPTQSQFKSLIDTFWSKEEDTIAIGNVSGLTEALDSKLDASAAVAPTLSVLIGPGVNTWQVPAGTVVEDFVVMEQQAISFGVGLTNGGNEWVQPVPLPAGGDIVSSKRYFSNQTPIYFSGITNATMIKAFFKQ